MINKIVLKIILYIYNNLFLNMKKYNRKLFFLLIILFLIFISFFKSNKKIKIGVIGVRHEVNIGNNLIKYAVFLILSELGFIPYIIGTHYKKFNITFLNKTTNLVIIKNSFKEIKKEDYDILMVNSDQTWRKFDKFFYDYAFLRFAENWTIPKFIYGASLGYDYWPLNSKDERIAKLLLKNFTGISIREKDSIKLIKKHLGIEPIFVIDPTLLIEKKKYLNIIKNYKSNKIYKGNFIFSYKITREKNMENFIINCGKLLNYEIYNYPLNKYSTVEEFLYQTLHCKAVITNSYHGVLFSIILNKPFIAFCFKNSAKARLISLGNLLGIRNRIFEYYEKPDVNLLTTPLNINLTIINSLKIQSINFIKKNLEIIFKNFHFN